MASALSFRSSSGMTRCLSLWRLGWKLVQTLLGHLHAPTFFRSRAAPVWLRPAARHRSRRHQGQDRLQQGIRLQEATDVGVAPHRRRTGRHGAHRGRPSRRSQAACRASHQGRGRGGARAKKLQPATTGVPDLEVTYHLLIAVSNSAQTMGSSPPPNGVCCPSPGPPRPYARSTRDRLSWTSPPTIKWCGAVPRRRRSSLT